jgi:O-antigen/teichoic acid export membrane protein
MKTLSLRSLFGGASIIAVGSGIVALLGFSQHVLLARALGPSAFGAWAVVTSFVGLTRGVVSFRMTEPLTRWLVELRQKSDVQGMAQLLSVALGLEIVIAVVAYVVVAIGAFFVSPQLAGGSAAFHVYVIFAMTALFGFADGVWYTVARDQRDFRVVAAFPVLHAGIRVAGICTLYLADRLTLTSAAIWLSLSSAAQLLILLVYLKHAISRKYGVRLSIQHLRGARNQDWYQAGFWPFLKSLYWSGSFTAAAKNADVLVLAYFRPAHEVGLYRLARTLANVLHLGTTALTSVLYQDVNEVIRRGDSRLLAPALRRIMPFWSGTVIVGCTAAVLISRDLIGFVFGPEYTGAWVPFCILMIGTAVVLLLFWSQPTVLALDQHAFYLKLFAITSLVALAAMLPAAWGWGGTGVAVVVTLMWSATYVGFTTRIRAVISPD